MQKSLIGERTARVVIALLFVAVLACFIMFFIDAQRYSAASPQSESDSQSVSSQPEPPVQPDESVLLEDEQVPLAPPSFFEDAQTPQMPQLPEEEDAEEEQEGFVAQNRPLNSAAPGKGVSGAVFGRVGEYLPDEEVLQAEWERLAGYSVLLPEESAIEPEYLGSYRTTAYCCEEYPHICGGNGVTASGTVPTEGLTIAADWTVLPVGSWVYIEGVGIRRVEDSGSAIKGEKLDVAVTTHTAAENWRGFGRHEVWVLVWGSGKIDK